MGLDWIPGVSQLKSTIQLIAGDVEGAARTQENFFKECPIVSQVTSAVQYIAGDSDGAVETQKRCLGTVNNVANGIPVVGHVKGAIHHLVGDHDGGNQALNAATRTTVVIGSGAAAAIATGGLAAIPAGIAAGGAYDLTATVITDKPQGYIAAIDNAVKNPSAGSIFDAVAVPVGDGLAGYSGGQLGKTVTNHIKVNNLEVARSVKMDQLNSAMFDDVGGTSGQIHSLGQQINALTSELNSIQHGTPQYWFDPKTGEVVSNSTSTTIAFPVVGYIDKRELDQARNIYRELYEEEADALFDFGIEYAISSTSNKVPVCKQKLKDYKQQKSDRNLNKKIPIKTYDSLRQPNNNNQRNDPNKQGSNNILGGQSFLPVYMPSEFNYTSVVMLNNARRGLYHSLIGHFDQWTDYIDFNSILSRNPVLRPFIEAILNSTTTIEYQNTMTQLIVAIRANIVDIEDVRSTFNDIQLEMHQFIQQNITYANYLGDGISEHGQLQVNFRVKDRTGKDQVMVICVSKELYNADSALGDNRSIREIITIFFKKPNKNDILMKLF